MWQSGVAATTMTWQDALAFCEDLTLAGSSDWRLPNHKELASIVDPSQSNPAISSLFAARPAAQFWSSTPTPNFDGTGYALDFASGSHSTINFDFTTLHQVRCVRTR